MRGCAGASLAPIFYEQVEAPAVRRKEPTQRPLPPDFAEFVARGCDRMELPTALTGINPGCWAQRIWGGREPF